MRNMERIAVTVCGSCRKKCKDGQRQMERKSVCQTACWDCFRHHRGCDGTRPCNRCKAKNRASSCRDCLPEECIRINKRRRTSRKNAGIPSPRVPWLKKTTNPDSIFHHQPPNLHEPFHSIIFTGKIFPSSNIYHPNLIIFPIRCRKEYQMIIKMNH